MASFAKGETCYWQGWSSKSSMGEVYKYGAAGKITGFDSDENYVQVKFDEEERPVFRATKYLCKERPPFWAIDDFDVKPGRYKIVATKGMALLEGPDMCMVKHGRLERDDSVEVEEVKGMEAESIIYGRLKEPEAWIVILAGNVRWADADPA